MQEYGVWTFEHNRNMSHTMYQTQAIILAKKNMQESNILYTLYTERFGLLYVSAQSIRTQQSKMKYHMGTFSLVTIDIVQGKSVWKLTGAHENISSLHFVSALQYSFLARISQLLMRLVQGEEVNNNLWSDIVLLYEQLPVVYDEDIFEYIELIFVSRTLYHLGYWNIDIPYLHAKNPFQEKYFHSVQESRMTLIKEINQRIQETQL